MDTLYQPEGMPVEEALPASTAVSRVERNQIGTIAGSIIADTEFFTIDDGTNPIVTFEFDSNGSVVDTPTLRALVFTGLETADEIRDIIVATVNAAPTLDILAAPGGSAISSFENTVGGDAILAESVANPGFVVITSPPDSVRLKTPGAFFVATQHTGRIARLAGAGIVDGDYRIIHVVNGTCAILEGAPLAAPGGPEIVTGIIPGAHWLVSVVFESNEIFTFRVGLDGGQQRDMLLPDLSINVSKFSGSVTLSYVLKLAENP